MSWILPVLGAWALLAVPGLLLMRAVGARVPVSWGVAPLVTVLLVIGVTGILHLLRIPWTAGTALLCTVGACALAVLVRRRLRRPGGRGGGGRHLAARVGDPRPPRRSLPVRSEATITAVGVLSGLAVVAAATRRMGGISTLNGSYDSFFHLSAIATIREGGDAFVTTALADIYGGTTYYPVVFDALAALLPLATIPAANVLMLAVLAAVPSAVGAMVAMLGPSGPTGAVPAVLATAASAVFLSIPAMALVMGLWPVVLGALCLPVGIAAALRLLGGRRAALTPAATAGYGALILATALAHPTMLFSIAVVAGLRLLVGGVMTILQGRRRRGAVEVAVALGAAVVYVVVSALLLGGMSMTRPAAQSRAEVLWEILVDSPRIPVIGAPFWPVAVVWVLALIGAFAAVRGRERLGTTAAVGVLCAIGLGMTMQLDSSLASAVVNPWYGARERIAPLMMCLLLVLLGRGVQALGAARSPRGRAVLVPVASAAVLLTVVAGVIAPSRLPLTGSLAYTAYGLQLSPYVTPAERDFIERTAVELPEDAVLLADPLDGAPLYWSIGGVDTVFPTMSQPQTQDSALLARYAPRVDDPGANAHQQVCAAAERIDPTHLYRDTSEHNGRSMNPEASARWRGVHDIPPHRLTLVAEDGPYALYELDLAC